MMGESSKPLYETINKQVFNRIHTRNQVRRSLLKAVDDLVYNQVANQVHIRIEIEAKVTHGGYENFPSQRP